MGCLESFEIELFLMVCCKPFSNQIFKPNDKSKKLCFRAIVLPIALNMDWRDLDIRILEMLVNNETYFLNVKNAYIITGFSISELSKHRYLLVNNKILFIFFPITIASPLPIRMQYKTQIPENKFFFLMQRNINLPLHS